MWSFIFIKISSTGSSNSNFRDVNHRKMPVLQLMERGDSKELSDMRSSRETLKRTASRCLLSESAGEAAGALSA